MLSPALPSLLPSRWRIPSKPNMVTSGGFRSRASGPLRHRLDGCRLGGHVGHLYRSCHLVRAPISLRSRHRVGSSKGSIPRMIVAAVVFLLAVAVRAGRVLLAPLRSANLCAQKLGLSIDARKNCQIGPAPHRQRRGARPDASGASRHDRRVAGSSGGQAGTCRSGEKAAYQSLLAKRIAASPVREASHKDRPPFAGRLGARYLWPWRSTIRHWTVSIATLFPWEQRR